MEALDFVVLVAGGWIAVIALAMSLLTAASRADAAAHETVVAPEAATDDRAAARPRLPRVQGAGQSGVPLGSA